MPKVSSLYISVFVAAFLFERTRAATAASASSGTNTHLTNGILAHEYIPARTWSPLEREVLLVEVRRSIV